MKLKTGIILMTPTFPAGGGIPMLCSMSVMAGGLYLFCSSASSFLFRKNDGV